MENITVHAYLTTEYNRLAYTHNYIFGYAIKGMVYAARVMDAREILPYIATLDRASSKNGGTYSIKYKPNMDKIAVIMSHAVEIRPICTVDYMEQMFANVEVGAKGAAELKELFGLITASQMHCDIELDLTLARGLNYYTGAIFEVKAKDVQIGSICGGGRYDNLTGIFGMPDVSGVGISFGADRIYDVLTELDAFPKDLAQAATVLFINFGPAEQAACIRAAAQLRAEGVATLVYPEAAKMKKQMDYANRKGVPFVAFIGESELQNGTVTLKNMTDGSQQTMTVDEMVCRLK